ncbi:MAG: ATPase, T2SS/T4P/T4SS family, partial [Candidatus Micrarchaeota archaeon]|nr:ATPase, T2SS/T4P/T4SS family [Candidatus Micrarchaeota archaeon]
MGLGWTLAESGAYHIPWSVALSERQERVLDLVLDRLSLLPATGPLRERLEQCLASVCQQERIRRDESWSGRVLFLAEKQAEGTGFFSHLLADDAVEEIAVSGIHAPVRVFVRGNGWQDTNAVITSAEFAVAAVNAMARPLGRRLTVRGPRLSAVLSDGSRLYACAAPLTPDGIQVSLRKFRKKPFSVRELVDAGFLLPIQAAFFSLALSSDAGLLVCGNTGSGKTTFLNAVFSFVPPRERVVLVEDVPELRLPHRHQARLLAGKGGIGPLVADTLRMRPDRLVVGEVRFAHEASALMDVLLSGSAKGAYATFHAQSAHHALSRLLFLGVSPMDLDALDLLVVLRRFSDAKTGTERRRLVELCAILDGKPVPVFCGKNVNPVFFRTAAFQKIAQSHGVDAA